jgi:RNA polymerase sigma factor (sigma-70 family)
MKFASPKFVLRPRSLNQAKHTSQRGAKHLSWEKRKPEPTKPSEQVEWPTDLSPLESIAKWASIKEGCPKHDLGEVADSTLVALIVAHSRISKAASPDAYARTVARNHARKIIIKEKKKPEVLLSELPQAVDPKTGESREADEIIGTLPGNGYQAWLRSGILENLFEALRAGLRLLPFRERMILERFYGLETFEATSIRDIASSLGLSETTVKHIKADVLERMRDFLCRVVLKSA